MLTLIRTTTVGFSLAVVVGAAACACPLGDCHGDRQHVPAPSGVSNSQSTIYWGVDQRDSIRFRSAAVPDGLNYDVVTFYEHLAGKVPQIKPNGQIIHGGVPQNADINAHLADLRQEIVRLIPDPNWDGLAVLDYESWKPLWDYQTAERYHNLSKQIVRQRHPGMSEAQVEQAARSEYERAAREFLERTFDLCKSLRPNAKWGMFAYSPGMHDGGQSDRRLDWLWSRFDAFYPAFYCHQVSANNGESWTRPVGWFADRVRRRIDAVRTVSGDRPIYGYVHPYYIVDNPRYKGKFINEEDYYAAFELPFEEGIDGVIIWSSAASAENRSQLISDLNGVFGDRLRASTAASTPSIDPFRRRAADAR